MPSSKLLAPWLALALFLPLLGLSQAGRGAPAEPERALGQGSRALARGGACVAWADDGAAGNCNPAGPALLAGLRFLFGLAPRDEERLLSISARWGALGLGGSWTKSRAEEAWTGAVALRAREGFALGVGLRSHGYGSGSGSMEFELGTTFMVGPALTVGLTFQNPLTRSDGGPLTRLGARLELARLRSGGELALSPTGPARLAWGAEVTLLGPVVLRLGYGGGRWAGGLGLESGRLNADLAFVLVEGEPTWVVSTEVILFREEVRE